MEIMKNENQLGETFASVSLEEVTTLKNVSSDNEMMNWDDSGIADIHNNHSKIGKYSIKRKERKLLKHGRVRPLFKSYPILQRVCNDSDNLFVQTKFIYYAFDEDSDEDQNSVDKFDEKLQNLKFIINFCGYNLKMLNISSYHFSDIMPLIKTNCPNIEVLILKFKKIDNKDFDNVFSKMSHLEKLYIEWDCENLTLPLTLVESLKQVGETLEIFHLSRDEEQDHICLVPDSLALVFLQLTALKKLFIYNFDVNQSLIDSIGELKELINLRLICFLINDSNLNKKYDMYPIGNLENIVYLEIDWINGITDEFLINLSNNAKKLRNLTITATHITDNGVIALNNLNELKNLSFNSFYSSQNKDYKYITDKSIQCLFTKNLWTLKLSNCIEITDSSVIQLVNNLPKLLFLHVNNTKVTVGGVKEMKKLKDSLFISHDFKDSNNI